MSIWQIKTTDERTGNMLCTTEMPDLSSFGYDLGYKFESCYFTSDDSMVMKRYNTQEDAELGHTRLVMELMDQKMID